MEKVEQPLKYELSDATKSAIEVAVVQAVSDIITNVLATHRLVTTAANQVVVDTVVNLREQVKTGGK